LPGQTHNKFTKTSVGVMTTKHLTTDLQPSHQTFTPNLPQETQHPTQYLQNVRTSHKPSLAEPLDMSVLSQKSAEVCLCPGLRDMRRSTTVFEGSQSSSACPCDRQYKG